MADKKSLAVLTSGGDAQGMNPAVRAVVRAAVHKGFDVYAIYEGYKGMILGGDYIRKAGWSTGGGILHKGGTAIGSARSDAFRTKEGRRQAVFNLISRGIDALVVIGGDGSLTGANVLRQEWTEHTDALLSEGKIGKKLAGKYKSIFIAGLVGSIDNDMCGTDMTIGADSALFRITEAVDAIISTAASHQRTFVVKVMGRNCGYLALMSALSCGADYVFIPEDPPKPGEWEDNMCALLKAGRESGRRDNIVILAEGARDTNGNPIGSSDVKQVLEERLGEDTRVTILGHVQRGGSPSAYDRYMTTLLGCAAVEKIATSSSEDEPILVGVQENDVITAPLMQCVNDTQEIREMIKKGDYSKAMDLSGGVFAEAYETLKVMLRTLPSGADRGQRKLRIAVLHGGGPAAGMNTAALTAVRIGLEHGHVMLGVSDSFQGLIHGKMKEMDWMSVGGWVNIGGAELGTNRKPLSGTDYYAIARTIEEKKIDAILMIGGWSGYQGIYSMYKKREDFSAFNIPMVCLPATINNNLPGTERSVGSDTALNNIMHVVDKIKQSAVASKRCFVVEVMGRNCGFLALVSGIATGAERVYLHEEGVKLSDLQRDTEKLVDGFSKGKRLGLMIRNERANQLYTTPFMTALFEEEGGAHFDVRQAILGHLQQGGDPSPQDRILAIRLARLCIEHLIGECLAEQKTVSFIGQQKGKVDFVDMARWPELVDTELQRPRKQWWMNLRPIARIMAESPENTEY
ncbi:MAG: 6-phosphofructokinase [Lewinellaceae bacterium]|nr:6-phosphofructokinase [Phaeodactylibacter sp.]MCB9038249.1 6-phosphofructokinase [Lewinellaceae bacterium]